MNDTVQKPGKPSFKKVGLLLLAVLVYFSFAVNDRKTIKVTQYPWGTVKVVTAPGPYMTWYGRTTTYNKASEYHFSSNKEEGGDGFMSNPIDVTFNRKSSAKVNGFLKFTLPLDKALLKQLDVKYGSNEAILTELVRNSTREALIQTGPLFTAEEADAPKKGLFREYAKAQLEKGLYAKHVEIVSEKDPSNPKKSITRQQTKLALVDGLPRVVEDSAFNTYGLKVEAFNVIDFIWDPTTEKLLVETKKIDMKRILSKAAAVTAQQNAIKEKAEGEARVAIANANALVLKETAVIEQQKLKEVAVLTAQKLFEVETLSAKTALAYAKKVRAQGMAKAAANQALVKAGLTPEKAAIIKKDMMIGMMEAWAKRPVPASIYSGGGNGAGGSGQVMLDIMGVKAAKDLMNMNAKTK